MKTFSPPRNRFLRGVYLMARRFLRHSVGIQSAALAFYLLFMIFPFLIFLSALLGFLHLDVTEISRGLGEFLPRAVVDLISMYLTYVRANPSPHLLVFGLVFSIYFPMRATNSLMRAVRTAYRLGPPKAAVGHILKTLLYTVVLICTIALTLTLMTVGDRLLQWAMVHVGLSPVLASAWARLRFPVAAAVGYFALFFLYALAQDGLRPWRDIWPGTLAALTAWMTFSWLFSFYMDNIANYSLLYGSIGTVIALLVWLNMSAVALIMGAEFNGTLISLREERNPSGG